MMLLATYFLFAYLLGSMSFAIMVCRYFRLHDPRTYGSGNAGAANVLRQGNHKIAIIVLLMDALKGSFVAAIAMFWILPIEPALLGGALMVLVGHMYPVFFGFKGGKGVATALGILLVAMPVVAICALVAYFIALYISKISSLAIFFSMAVAVLMWSLIGFEGIYGYLLIELVALVLFGLRSNIWRLFKKSENRVL